MYPQVFGKYILERELARGGMARVLLATLRGAGGFEKKLVVKQIRDELAYDQEFVRRFVEEAKTTVALSHPNIVPVYELGVEQGTYFLAMELVEGASVAELLRERNDDGSRRVLTPVEGAYVGLEVCRALEYAHRRMNVVHRDITPRNVMVDEEGQVKVIDFGIAAPALVAGQEVFGSPGHMPPEQVQGHELGPATDIFALGVLLMEAWTGAAPFRRATLDECETAMLAPHPTPSSFDARLAPLDDVIARAMRLSLHERQGDASEVARAFRAFLRDFDPGEIARALGDRVRNLRLAQSAPLSQRDDAGRATFASVSDVGTRTFAAREEALEWSRAQSGARLSIPTPLMIQSVGGRPPWGLGTTHDVGVEQEGLHETFLRKVVAPRNVTRRWGGRLVGLVGGVLGGVVAWRIVGPFGTGAPPNAAIVPQAASSKATPELTPAPPPDAALRESGEGPAPSGSVRVARRPESEGSSPRKSLAPPSRLPPAAKAQLLLSGDIGTRVFVDGSLRGDCPVRAAVDPGVHTVRFVFAPTGESQGEQLVLQPAETVTVRADFAGALPSVRVSR